MSAPLNHGPEKAEMLKAIGVMLRKARTDREVSLRGLSGTTGVSVAYLCDLEYGRRSFSPERLREISTAVGMDEPTRLKLFVAAKMLPPAVRERTLKAPKTWSYDPQKLLTLALDLKRRAANDPELCAELGSDVLNSLARALQKTDW